MIPMMDSDGVNPFGFDSVVDRGETITRTVHVHVLCYLIL